jgi:hypothetical protein
MAALTVVSLDASLRRRYRAQELTDGEREDQGHAPRRKRRCRRLPGVRTARRDVVRPFEGAVSRRQPKPGRLLRFAGFRRNNMFLCPFTDHRGRGCVSERFLWLRTGTT